MRTDLKTDENVILLIRPHWFVLFWPVILTVTGLIAGIYLGDYGYIIPLVLICYLFYKIIQRKNNLWAVTNLRIIDEDGVFSINSKESPLDKINNVTYNQSLWGRIFDYGNIQIQTAAEIGSTTYYMVEKPKKLKDMITTMQEEYKRSQILSQAKEYASAISSQKQSRNDLAAELEKLFELKQKGILSEEEYNMGKKRILEG